MSFSSLSRFGQNPKNRIFFKGVNPCFWSKNAIFLIYSDLVKIRVEIMLTLHWSDKRNRFDCKKQHFSKSNRSHFFKGVNPCFWSKNAIFFLYLDFVKIRLQIMLNYFKEKKRNLFWPYKNEFFKLLKNALFNFWPKNAIFFLYQRLIKIRLEIMLSDFTEKKKPFFTLKTEFL